MATCAEIVNETEKPSAILWREPYRLFFPLGMLWAVIATTHWIAMRAGWTHNYAPLYHGYLQILGFGGCFATGFLMTALPSFLGSYPAKSWEVLAGLTLAAATGVLLILDLYRPAVEAFLALVLLLSAFGLRRYSASGGMPAPPVVYIAWGLVHALVGAVMVLLNNPAGVRFGIHLLEQGMLLSFVLGIGSFLGARLLGTFQPPMWLMRPRPGKAMVPPPVRFAQLFAFGGLILFLSFWIESFLHGPTGRAVRAAIVTFQFIAFTNIHRRPQTHLLIVHLLRASYWMIVGGLWLAVAWPWGAVVALHATYIGGFGLMMLVMGVRVVSSHGGVDSYWSGIRPFHAWIAVATAGAVLVRVAAPMFPSMYASLLALAAILWDAALLAWAVTLLPRVRPSCRPAG